MAYLRPGVYIEETLNPIPPLAGPDANSIAAFVGAADRGPLDPTLVTSWTQYTSLYGSWGTLNTLTTAVYLFFANGGNQAYVKRVTAGAAASATRVFDDRSATTDPTLNVFAKNPGTWGNSIYITITDSALANHFDLVVYNGGTTSAFIVERYTDLNMTVGNERYAPTAINAVSNVITTTDANSAAVGALRNPGTVALQPLAAGATGNAVTESDIANSMSSFDTVTSALVLNAPGVISTSPMNTILSYAEGRDDVFVVIDAMNDTVANQMTRAATYTSTSLGAVYYPNLTIPSNTSSSPGAVETAFCGGAIVGQFISTDVSRGVFKAPAGVNNRIAGAVAVQKLTNANLDTMNSASAPVNAIRFIPGSGIVVMGSRTLKAGYADRYVPVRRSLIYLRKALTDLTDFAVFEPNDAVLWRRIKASLEGFLTDYWSQGGLRGATPADAFFVKCDSSTNTLIKIDNGEVNMEIGVALQRPAEFVIIKIGQYDGGTTVTVA